MLQSIENKNVLVTGGAGYIGKGIVKRLVEYSPNVIRVLDNNEERLSQMSTEFSSNSKIRCLLGDLRDSARLFKALEDIDVVFHTASLRHVSICEYNPFEAVKTNDIGTQNIINDAGLVSVQLDY